jgi:Protein of unknown function (DUF1552)
MSRPRVQSLSAITPSDLGRRHFLRGAGGAAVGVPLLEYFSGNAQAQMTPPKRVLFMTAGHSQEPGAAEAWSPVAAHNAALPANLSPILSPLIAHRDRLLVVDGIDNIASGLQPTNGHNGTSRTMLSVMPIKKALDANGNLLAAPPECTIGEDAAGPSIDYFLADAWKETMLSLRVGAPPDEHVRSFRMDLSRDLHEGNPQTAFTRLFQGYKGGTLSPADRLRNKRASILDNVRGNFDRLITRVGGEDKIRLQRHADQIRQLETGLQTMVKLVCDNPMYKPPQPLTGVNFNDGNARFDDKIVAGQLELVKMAFACQATRVAHIHFTNIQENKFPFLNGGQDLFSIGWHGVIHKDVGTDEHRLQTMQWYTKVVADAISLFAATPEGDKGTLLDNTLIVFMSSLRQSWHGTYSLPTILAGNLNGTLKTGRYLKYNKRTTGDFFTTLLNVLDVPATSFGWTKGARDGTPFFTGPLPGFVG